MPADLIRSNALSDVAQYAYAAAVPEGDRLVFLAGSCPLDESGATVAVGDYRRQAEQYVANLRTVLSELSADLTDRSARGFSWPAPTNWIWVPLGRLTVTPSRRTIRRARCLV